jgi:hypothetical protein
VVRKAEASYQGIASAMPFVLREDAPLGAGLFAYVLSIPSPRFAGRGARATSVRFRSG